MRDEPVLAASTCCRPHFVLTKFLKIVQMAFCKSFIMRLFGLVHLFGYQVNFFEIMKFYLLDAQMRGYSILVRRAEAYRAFIPEALLEAKKNHFKIPFGHFPIPTHGSGVENHRFSPFCYGF